MGYARADVALTDETLPPRATKRTLPATAFPAQLPHLRLVWLQHPFVAALQKTAGCVLMAFHCRPADDVLRPLTASPHPRAVAARRRSRAGRDRPGEWHGN